MGVDQQWRPLDVTPDDIGAAPTTAGLLGHLADTELIGRLLTDNKALVFRGFHVDAAELEPVLDLLLPNRLAYVHGNSPRTKVGDNLYTSTEYPPEFTISMHNELSYSHRWPDRLLFFCATAPETGGATPIVDGTRWLASIDPAVREAFAGGVCYTQELHGGYGLGKSWQDTFETDRRADVEAFLRETAATWEWRQDDALRISQVRPSTVRHPVTGVEVWFNQADQWHPAALGDQAPAGLEMLSDDELPQSVRFADGSPIPAEYVVHIREQGLNEAVDVDWHTGDLLLIDNVLVAHGRRPFTGDRRILVAMSNH